ncbi:MAG: thermonuclease family protein [Solirubrobacteraceae bacterium]
MSWRRALPWLLLFVVLSAAGARGLGLPGKDEAAVDSGRITRVVDGDTVHVAVAGRDETVRYIGVDTPETKKPGAAVECFGKAASAANARLVSGELVRLRFDAERRDRYGRLLAYLFRRRDGLFVNAALLRGGFATTLAIAPNLAQAGRFRTLERRARARGKGLWRAC